MSNTCVAIGTFDGVHRGHQGLIDKLLSISRKTKTRSVIVALSKPVRHVSGLLSELSEKKSLLNEFPVHELCILPVTRALITMSAQDFLTQFLVGKLHCRHLVVGQNFAFGHSRHGDVHWLKKNCPQHNIDLAVERFTSSHGKIISSSRIRELLHSGRLEFASRLLGRMYSFEGLPQKGRGLGHKIGVPTINLKVTPEKLLPLGIFAAVASAKGSFFPAIVNIGRRPTIEKNGAVIPEVNLLGYQGRWGKEKLKVFLLKHLRKERKFRNIKELKNQINSDLRKVRRYFGFTF
jgi:riboflavin kinase/FMN adenylyltransferase